MISIDMLQADLSSVPILIAVAAIIIIGYIARAIFRRTKIPEALILIALGVVLGQFLTGSIIGTLRSLAAIFGDIALVVIMYSGGRAMVLNRSIVTDRRGMGLGFLDALVPMVAISLLMWLAFGWPLVYGALLGAILGETSTVIVVPLLKKIEIDPEMYGTLLLETTLNSVFAIMFFTLLLSYANGQGLTAGAFTAYALDYISISILMGLLGGIVWLVVQNYIKGAREYLATLAMAILLYGIVEQLNGAAAISVLIFALILGNYKPIAKFLGLSMDAKRKEIRERNVVERVIEFLIITFFFVFIGIIAYISLLYLVYAAIVTVVLCAIRYLEMEYVLGDNKTYRNLGFALMQRGTVVAVLAAILFSLGGGYFDQIFYICFMVIITTNIIGSILISRTELSIKQQ